MCFPVFIYTYNCLFVYLLRWSVLDMHSFLCILLHICAVVISIVSMANCTPVKEINVGISDSPKFQNETHTLNFTNKFIRQLKQVDISCDSYVERINKCLPHVQFHPNERLESRLNLQYSKSTSDYKKVKGGNNKTKFDMKVISMTVYMSEFKDFSSPVPCVSTPEMLKTGIRLDNTSKSNKQRIVKKLEQNTGKALEFVESYGVIPKKLICETFTGQDYTVNVDGVQVTKKESYENMTSVQKEEVIKITNICDNGLISDAAYHELAILFPEMPRKSHLASCRQDINSKFDVNRCPGMIPGSYLSFNTELKSDLNELLKKGLELEKCKVKISGDGAKVSRVSNFIVMSYSIITDDTPSSQKHSDQKVLAVVNCDEKYANIKQSLGPLFGEINDLNSCGEIDVGSKSIGIELFVGGDMKFLQILLGLNSSIANYACPWCKVPKDARGDISFQADYYNSSDQIRTIKELKTLSASSSKLKFGVIHAPLLNIEPTHYLPDELHLMLRVTDVLLRNVIYDAKSKDDYGKLTGQPTDNLNILIKAIQSCGVSFKTWVTKSGELEWTSLTGNDKKKVLCLLPDKLLFCLHTDTITRVVSLWKKFKTIYELITDKTARTFDEEEVHAQIKLFMGDFLEIGQLKREGYQPKNITPYLHALLFHVPFFVSSYGSLSLYSGQGVEKANDIVKKIHQTKSNKQDPTVDTLLVRKRIELGIRNDVIRKKRPYTKLNEHYWSNEISYKREMKRQKIERERREIDTYFREESDIDNFEHSTVQELKQKLSEFGVKTKVRKKEKLIEMLKQHIPSK